MKKAAKFSTASGCPFITYKSSKRRFLIDTGSDLCVFPRKLIPQPGHVLTMTSHLTALPSPHMDGCLDLRLRRDFMWRFVVADVTQPLIVADFLSHFGLLVDFQNNRLLDGVTLLSTPAQTGSPRIPSIKVISGGISVDTLLSEFPDLTRPIRVKWEVRHNTVHHIWTTTGPPVTCRPRLLACDRFTIAKAEFEAMVLVRDGTARPSESSWSSALHIVPKKDNCWRPYGDYRALIAQTIPDRNPVCHIHDYSHKLSGCRFFSKMLVNLCQSAWHCIPLLPP
jgi:hypothetical protein